MNSNFNIKQSAKNFLSLFKLKKHILIIAVIATILSIIVSILIPLKTGMIIDSIIDNIKTNKLNEKSIKTTTNFKPFISKIETINFEALNTISTDITVEDLIEYGLLTNKDISIIDKNIQNKLLQTKANKLKNINCYDCNDIKDYTKPVNSIYKILNVKKEIQIIDNKANYILENIILVIILIIIEFLLHYITNLSMSKLSKEITSDLRNKINKKTLNIPLQYFITNKQGDILSLVTNDIENISASISTDIIEIINSSILFIGLLIAMFNLSTKLTLIIICIIPFIFILLLLNVIKSSKYFNAKQNNLGKYNDFILNSYNNFKIIKTYNQRHKFINKEKVFNKELFSNTWKSNFYSNLMQPIVQFSGNINFLVVCVFGSISVINGNLTIGTLQAFLSYAQSFNNPLISITTTIGIIGETLASTNRVFNFLNIDEEKKLPYKETNFKNEIEIQNVCFSYTDKEILKDINLTIKKGEKVAIVGETGSGKTTLIKLLLGFYKINKGNIKIDGTDITNINHKALRELIGVVLQDSWIFDGTIKENISYGSKEDFKQVKIASKLANLEEIINKLPNSYDYQVINSKNNLSKGEKQLISIARLFMQKKDILILDEATSNIDIETENKIKQAINKLMKNKTCIIIAHRLSTIINSDKIIVMHNGRIVEQGKHKDLLKLKGYYYNIYESEFK